ncbi:MAG: hypothetical protein, partial [Olavius algarvensis Gamma 3 endosymbiont]
ESRRERDAQTLGRRLFALFQGARVLPQLAAALPPRRQPVIAI